MGEQENRQDNQEQEPKTAEEYIKAINDLKENTVPKEQYQKLEKDNQVLIEALKTHKPQEAVEQKKEKVNIKELATDILENGKEMNFLEGIEKTLKLRDAMKEQMNIDPFLPTGKQVEITDEMRAKADKVAKIYQECIEIAAGDPQIFTAELQRRTEDIPLPRKR